MAQPQRYERAHDFTLDEEFQPIIIGKPGRSGIPQPVMT